MTTQLLTDDNHKAIGWNYRNIATQTTTVVKTGEGFLHTLTINTPLASGVATVYDNTAGSGTKIATITFPGTLLNDQPTAVLYDIKFSTGLTIVTSGANVDITATYI